MSKQEKGGKGDKPAKGGKGDKPEKADKPADKAADKAKADKAPKADKAADKPAKSDKADKPAAKPDKSDKADKSAKPDKADKADKADKVDKVAKADKADKAEKIDKTAPIETKDDKKGSTKEGGDEESGAPRERKPFRRFFYRGLEVHKLLDLSHAELMKLMTARARRRFARGHVPMNLIRRLRKAKKEAPQGEKPKVVKTHLRDMIIVPEMVASIVGVYNGKSFTQVEIKPDMIGHYLGEFAITYKPVKHGRPGVGATNSSRFIPLK